MIRAIATLSPLRRGTGCFTQSSDTSLNTIQIARIQRATVQHKWEQQMVVGCAMQPSTRVRESITRPLGSKEKEVLFVLPSVPCSPPQDPCWSLQAPSPVKSPDGRPMEANGEVEMDAGEPETSHLKHGLSYWVRTSIATISGLTGCVVHRPPNRRLAAGAASPFPLPLPSVASIL
jgi:hypothetical protein